MCSLFVQVWAEISCLNGFDHSRYLWRCQCYVQHIQVSVSVSPPSLWLFVVRYKQDDSSQLAKLLMPGENPSLFPVCVFLNPIIVCGPPGQLGDHTGVRPPQWWWQTTGDVAVKKKDMKGKRWGEAKSDQEEEALCCQLKMQPCRERFRSEHMKSR